MQRRRDTGSTTRAFATTHGYVRSILPTARYDVGIILFREYFGRFVFGTPETAEHKDRSVGNYIHETLYALCNATVQRFFCA